MQKPDPEQDQMSLSAENAATQYEFGASERNLTGWQNGLIAALCVLYTAFHLLILNAVQLDAWVFRAIHVNVAAVIVFALYAPFGRPGARMSVFDIALSLCAIAAVGYIWYNLNALTLRTGVMSTSADVAIAALGIVVVIEFTRRSAGMALPILAGVFMLYGFVGPWLPGILFHRGYSFGDFTTFVYSLEGIFGIATAAAAFYIVLFVTFAAFLRVSKVGDFFMNIAFAAFGGMRGGPAKASLFGSILFGMISGSGVANVVASGTFTIPVMKRAGYKPSSAGAIEAAASTGGQLTPPIMGAGAFIMAEVTGIPYTTIIVAALIPCLLYFFAVFVHIDLEARREGIKGLPRSELPELRPLLKDAFILAPLGILIIFLFSGYSIIASGSWGIAASIVVMLQQRLQLDTRIHAVPLASILITIPTFGLSANQHGMIAVGLGLLAVIVFAIVSRKAAIIEALQGTIADIGEALTLGTKQSLQLAAVCACAGIVVGVIGLTGLGGRFSALLLGVAGNSEFMALVFAMIIALILGMGMPTTAAYAIAASVIAPALQRMGFDVLGVHLFIFYFAVVSTITPPIALSAFAGAALAGANPWETAFKAVRYGIAAFLVPFIFIQNSAILMDGPILEIVRTSLTAAGGVWALATASEGWLRGRLSGTLRLTLLVAAFFLLAGGVWTDLIGLALGATIVLWRNLMFRRTEA